MNDASGGQPSRDAAGDNSPGRTESQVHAEPVPPTGAPAEPGTPPLRPRDDGYEPV
jgi:hypothetical protein